MTIPMKTDVASIEEQFSNFARDHIAPLPGLGHLSSFPENLWEKMGKENLLNPALFKDSNLDDTPCPAITRAGRAVVCKGGNLGMALSWMVHHLVACYLLSSGGGNDGQDPSGPLREAVAIGAATISFAVSEPRSGAHPKYMTATATQTKTGYILNGEKTYLTNGPIARAFIVIAVTGIDKGKKQFSAFLVPKNTKGLSVLPPMKIPFFNPSPHGGICMKDCRVPENALLGRQGHAHGDMVLAFRRIEDAAMTGIVTGAMAFLLDAVARETVNRNKSNQDKSNREDAGDGIAKRIGRLATMIETADLLSRTAALAVDDPASCPALDAILLQFKDLAVRYVAAIESLVEKNNLILADPFAILVHDLKSSALIGKNITRTLEEKLGRTLLEKYL
jgi:alkylation response protein AidB-like acyl-CoA dehydrogenase